jgi:hypothetical protein
MTRPSGEGEVGLSSGELLLVEGALCRGVKGATEREGATAHLHALLECMKAVSELNRRFALIILSPSRLRLKQSLIKRVERSAHQGI